jgi:hypothetical protein
MKLPGEERMRRSSRRVLLTAYWRDHNAGFQGRERLPLHLHSLWSDLITPPELNNHCALARFFPVESNHLSRRGWVRTQALARHAVCAAARVLQFMDATKLRPSASRSRGLPGGTTGNAVPGSDHYSVWFDRENRYLLTDEPREKVARATSSQRAEWARHHRFIIFKPSWPGMYKPDAGSRLYLIVDAREGVPLTPIVAALERSPAPNVAGSWGGKSILLRYRLANDN